MGQPSIPRLVTSAYSSFSDNPVACTTERAVRRTRLLSGAMFAHRMHAGITRRHGGEPYEQHLLRVASRACYERTRSIPVGGFIDLWGQGLLEDNYLSFTEREEYHVDLCLAALLHDVVEDTTADLKDVYMVTGSKRVQEWVACLTEPAITPRKDRLWSYTQQLAAAPTEVHLIKQMDIMDNIPSIYANEKGFWPKYREEKIAQLEAMSGGCRNTHAVLMGWLNEHT